jgi:hypothetical protein
LPISDQGRAGEAGAAGEVGDLSGEVKGAGAWEAGLVSSRTTEVPLRWEAMMAREREVNMKTIAATVVSLLKKVAVPRVPKMVWLAPLPKALPI